jgi:two-component system response regulator QseB
MAEGKAKILVIDDNAAILELIEQSLTPDYDVTTTDEWLEGVSLLTERHFDLLILDLGMPVFDAKEFIRKVPTLSSKPIAILIISALPNLEQLMADVQVDGILAKPFFIQDLQTLVEKLLAQKS